MTGPSEPDPGEAAATAAAPAPPPRRRGKIVARTLAIAAAAGLLALLGLLAVRAGADTGPGRAAIVRLLDGLPLGSLGRLRLSGLTGDPFGRFALRRLRIEDGRGPWLEADDVALDWRPAALFVRTVRIDALEARRIAVLRPPPLKAPAAGPAGRPPVNLDIDKMRFGLETGADVSVRPGVWSVEGAALLRRSGRIRVRLAAESRLRPGDGLRVDVRLGDRSGFSVAATGREANGGALAGLLGLPADQALNLDVTSQGRSGAGSGSALITSGARPVLSASASWTDRGGRGAASADLSLSRLTRFAAERLGGRVAGVFTAKPLKGSLFDVTAKVTADLGRAALEGPLDVRTRRVQGMALDVEVPLLSRWLPFPSIGPARFVGRADGGWGDARVDGRVEGGDVKVLGYDIARASGPMKIAYDARGWRILGDLAGAGGAGPGLSGALVGASPKVRFDLAVLRGGRFLFRALNLAGAGISVDATGGEGLFGGLSFQGTVLASDLSRARPGLRGRLSGDFKAEEAAHGHAWDFTFAGGASGFSSGGADLDHFLGASPTIAGSGSYVFSEGLTLREARLTGKAAGVEGRGTVARSGELALDADWKAAGPFALGPLEIAGAAHGKARITGVLSAPKTDLDAELATLDLGPLVLTPARVSLQIEPADGGAAGAFELSGRAVRGGGVHARAGFLLAGGGFSLKDLVAEAGGVRATGSGVFQGGRLLSGDLAASLGPGLLLDAGRAEAKLRLDAGQGDARARIAVEGEDLVLPDQPLTLKALRLQGEGPISNLPLAVELTASRPEPVTFKGRGTFGFERAATSLSLTGVGRIRKSEFKLLEPFAVRLIGPELTAAGALAVAGGEARLAFKSGVRGAEGSLSARSVQIEAFDPDFTGAVTGEAELAGSGGRLTGRLKADLQKVRSRDLPASEALSGSVEARLENQRISLKGAAANTEGLRAEGEADLPAEATAAPFRIALDRTKPLAGSFKVVGEVRPLWDVLAGGERSLSGQIDSAGTLSGSLNNPVLLGSAVLQKGAFRDAASGLVLEQLEVNSTFGADNLTIRRLSASDGRGGAISGEGSVGLSEAAASTFTISVKRFQLLDNDLGKASASGVLTAAHPARGEGRLSGALTIDRADFVAAPLVPSGVVPLEVLEINQPERPAEAERRSSPSPGPPVTLDVSLRAPRGIYVKGRGLNVELSLDAKVGGNIAHPLLSGVARVVSGSYDFAGKRFDVGTSGTIRLSSNPADIRLDLSATWEDPTITALVRVQGTAAKPDIKLTSIPVLPQDEVLARVLFGVSASQLSAAQGAEMASALASIAGGGGFDVIGNLRQFAGLDRLALGSTLNSSTTISGGKYLSKDVYLELTGGARNGTGAQVEWRIRKNLALVSRYGAALDPRYPNDTDASLSVRFRTDF